MSSQDHDTLSVDGSSLPDAPAQPVQHGCKSFKRKYAKQKIHFEQVMKESNDLFKEEMRILELSKRLKEQNDQLLELLLELNTNVHIPPQLRYKLDLPDSELQNLQSPESEDDIPSATYDATTSREKLNEAKEKLLAGEVTIDDCRRLEKSILRSESFAPALEYEKLLRVPHTPNTFEPHSAGGDIDSRLGFLSPERNVDTSASVDSKPAPGGSKLGERLVPLDIEREVAVRNPVSVYNWLRKHQPNVFLQDADTTSEKATSRSTNQRVSKRQSAQARKEEDVYDEDGILVDVNVAGGGGSTRSKRKREEDPGYRPKGGSSGRSRKRKDDGGGSKRAKRPSAAASAV
ncbi:hypothetical protein AJ80_07444 [Polytolypa hystricis UAMH7299]|uniref:IEC3 subunit of the Ino80 complex, chromatin re-modelling-domain-containing protein n=1 Tax=Polytolypa hystricis (strain UAMH7299) TaxID=1447883 RepID=A0A2B7XQ10_POLH7|nr:hypothetical protein AJ80_07444 [Polytolypa hystricis UAMH7299]